MNLATTPARTPWVERQLQPLLAQPGQAWLLQGPSGLGQYELALALVSAWLCESPGTSAACGHCPSCHAIAVRTHADLRVLMPETDMLQRGWPLDEKAQQEIDDKKRKPSREIRIEAMRDAIEFAQRTDARGRGKAVLVIPAERMNHVTANALLKTLEEPPGALRFVLATEAAHLLLPTIRSRCLSHTLQWPDTDAALAWLVGQGVPAADAAVWLRASGGRPDDALQAAQSGRPAASWSRLPRALAQGEVAALADWSGAELVEVLQKVCHDALVAQCGGQPRFFERADLPASLDLPALSDWSRALVRSARSAEHPFNAGLMVESLVQQASLALTTQSVARLPPGASRRT